ncbi:EF-Tu C-terminal domain-related protein [Kordia jejudonensis]|uniref:EF-Tu C-terminal domain-related protein n=1 Tax=Kordia jejudonensis TaxID=1348245 RepID=UPI00062991F5|nr:protein chain elongation factor EF-Tu [Kordia jejudonensis]
MLQHPDFIAELRFLTTEEGGRKSAVHAGYRPHIEFENYPEYLTSGQQTYLGQDIVEMGTTILAEIAIFGTAYFTNRLYEDMKFKFCEGRRTIGFGNIVEIINKDLRCDSHSDQYKINLNLYPADILKRLASDYKTNVTAATQSIQEFIISHTNFQSPRIVRALLFTGNKDSVQLNKMIALARTDWRDLLLEAEYETPDKRVRDFTKEFGKENINPEE